MMSSSLPASALNWSTASRRLPLPSTPSAKLVGVMVVGTHRSSRSSSSRRCRQRCLCRREPDLAADAKHANFANEDVCHGMEDPPESWGENTHLWNSAGSQYAGIVLGQPQGLTVSITSRLSPLARSVAVSVHMRGVIRV